MNTHPPSALRFALLVSVLGCSEHKNAATPAQSGSAAGSTAGGTGASSASAGTSASVGRPNTGGAGNPASVGVPTSGSAGNSASVGRPNTGSAGSTSSASSASGSGSEGIAGAAGQAGSISANATAGSGAADSPHFSFFVTSIDSMRKLSGNDSGFGGDLRYGEATGLAGADKICTEIAESSYPGTGKKGWHAFLSAKAAGPNGAVVHARDRIGSGPWYDRTGRLVAMTLDTLLTTRPAADSAIVNDLPNERGEPNHGTPDIDNHDVVTASDAQGSYSNGVTCNDWTTTETVMPDMPNSNGFNHNGPTVGHSWPAQSGQSWIRAHSAPGCSPSVSLTQTGAGSGTGIGNGGGYGGIYCFAMTP